MIEELCNDKLLQKNKSCDLSKKHFPNQNTIAEIFKERKMQIWRFVVLPFT